MQPTSRAEGNPSRNLFVAGVPKDYTDVQLRALFTGFGDIVSAKIMLDLKTGASRQFGFVAFRTVAEAASAISALNNVVPDGGSNALHVTFSRHNDNEHASECERLYVRNLPRWVKAQHMQDLFSKFGNVVEVSVLPEEHNSDVNKGVGFVRYQTVHEAKEAIASVNETKPFDETHAILVRFIENASMKQERQGRRKESTYSTGSSNGMSASQLSSGSMNQSFRSVMGNGQAQQPTAANVVYNSPMMIVPPQGAGAAPTHQPVYLPVQSPGQVPHQQGVLSTPQGTQQAGLFPAPAHAPQPNHGAPPPPPQGYHPPPAPLSATASSGTTAPTATQALNFPSSGDIYIPDIPEAEDTNIFGVFRNFGTLHLSIRQSGGLVIRMLDVFSHRHVVEQFNRSGGQFTAFMLP